MIEFKQISKNRTPWLRRSINYIVIHDTGNTNVGANANTHFTYFDKVDRKASADFFVDSEKTLQVNNYKTHYTWHCGDGKGKHGITNMNSIGIEMCVNSDGDYDATWKNTIALVKELQATLNISNDCVVRHFDASRKNCPASMNQDGNWSKWIAFKEALSDSGVSIPIPDDNIATTGIIEPNEAIATTADIPEITEAKIEDFVLPKAEESIELPKEDFFRKVNKGYSRKER